MTLKRHPQLSTPDVRQALADGLVPRPIPADVDLGGRVEKTIVSLNLLGRDVGLGEFRAGRIEDGRSSRLLLATPRPALVSVPKEEAERLLALMAGQAAKRDKP